MTNGYDKCANCGGDYALHHAYTDQCPLRGREAPADSPQEWTASTFQAQIPFNSPSRLASSMTMREHFAAMAMPAITGNPTLLSAIAKAYPATREEALKDVIAVHAVAYADALIAALNGEIAA